MSCAADLPDVIAPVIFACDALTLSADEKAFFREASPAGFILFARNCDNPDQVRALVADLRESAGWHAPVLIDQEGGRIQRLRPPHWPDFPPQRRFGDLYAKGERDAAFQELSACVHGLARVQLDLGIDVDCIPVLDVVPDGLDTRVIDDRAFSRDPQIVATLGVAAVQAAIEAGITPVMKHVPGHGRANADSHFELPRVSASRDDLAACDWLPFRAAASAIDNTALWAMTAHVMYDALDPDLPATLSPAIVQDVIRGEIGFDGILLGDDPFMEALAAWGDVPTRMARSFEAGCDLALPCRGSVAERAAMLTACPAMTADTRRRFELWARGRKAVDTALSSVA